MKFRWIARSVARCYLRLLLGIPSAVEQSLTSQGRVALFFTHRLRPEYPDRTWSRRQIVRDPSTSLRSAQDDKGENSARSVTRCSADELAESTRHGRSHARRLIFAPRMHTFCHPERKQGPHPWPLITQVRSGYPDAVWDPSSSSPLGMTCCENATSDSKKRIVSCA